jgi:hypothetical protein
MQAVQEAVKDRQELQHAAVQHHHARVCVCCRGASLLGEVAGRQSRAAGVTSTTQPGAAMLGLPSWQPLA